ncbi:pyrroline-5-carboxylate reductase [Streptomyces sp. NPDC006314]|uniref:pyrroline-5-carboxylate reductase n=1 Tax=Streptomyces sp. NPDC006314 TaxID=3154475 RepID=UPI0033B61CFB
MISAVHRAVVIGAGHMGTAIIAGLREKAPELPLDVVEIAESRIRLMREEFGIRTRSHYEPQPGDTVILAVQPQQFQEFAAAQRDGAFKDALVVSVMAGVGIAAITSLLGTSRVVRAIPNTPSQVSQGMTVVCPGADVTRAERERAERVLSVIGRVLTTADEALIDDATALCGGGPAFVAHIADAFAGFAVKAGFHPDQARLMVCQVLRGTADLLESTGRDPQELCREVTTPGGTTERGLSHMREQGLRDVLVEALGRSANRSRELGAIGRTPSADTRTGGGQGR